MPELALPSTPAAVPQARAAVRRELAAHSQPDAVVEAAELVVTELVTNAVLHGADPVLLRLTVGPSRVRVEVQDSGHGVPVLPRRSDDAMTGRGLRLVAALCAGWGVETCAAGKAVWAELTPESVAAAGDEPAAPPDLDLDALLAGFDDSLDEGAPELFTVRLGAVPTDLLLSAKAHIDNVVRELTLARQGEASSQVPDRLVQAATRRFASARDEIKRQALAAAARGEVETALVLRQPASAADAGEDYLAALDEADRFARAARLLTLEAPPLHRLFRRWYVQSLVDQLRAQAAGRPAPTPPTLLQVLGEEVAALSALRVTAGRLRLLQEVTADLAAATTEEEAAAVVVDRAVRELGALAGQVFLLEEDVLRSVAYQGGHEPWARRYERIGLDEDLPGPEVVRTGRTLLLRDAREVVARYPALEGLYSDDRVLHIAPLTVGDHRVGVLALVFPAVGELDEATQIAFVASLADALAQTLERTAAQQRAALAQERLTFLADASVVLSQSLDVDETVSAVGRLLVPRLADWFFLQVVDGEGLRTLGLQHADDGRVAWAASNRDRYPVSLDAPTGAPAVVRTGRSELHAEVPEELVTATAVDAEHLGLLRELGVRSALVLPLTGRGGTFGAVTLLHTESDRRYSPDDVPFLEDVCRRVALALETASTFTAQTGRLADVTRIAMAAQQAILAEPPARVGPVALSARYVSAAAEARVGGDLYEVVSRPGAVRLVVGDVRGKGLGAVRTATVVLGEFRGAAADLDDLADVARQIDRRLRPYLGEEDFVTALLAEVRDDGGFTLACCGHPPALLCSRGALSPLETAPSLPLGLGADPVLLTGRLEPGDRLLLYTDGIIEARDAGRHFLDLLDVVRPLSGGRLEDVLDGVLAGLRAAAGPDLGDDLALLVAEYRP
ncbi:MAG: hypothetical protein JWM64_584 [Frankiales bacterium]|nr:hypothetical protein [Frankiales bacterium]